MNNVFKVFLVLLPIIVFSQDYSQKKPFVKSVLIKQEHKKKLLTINPFTFCDTDSDGFIPINLDEVGNYVFSDYSSQLVDDSGIYIGTSSSQVQLVTALGGLPQIQQICTDNEINKGMFDIAVNQNGEMYFSAGNKIYKINPLTCQIEKTYTFGANDFINSLSFDRNSNMYLGGFDSSVYRLEKGDYDTMKLWKNFGSGTAAGDFVMLGNKMYIAWNVSGDCKLYEVTVDNNTNYVSHMDLGNLPNGTYGLASELGNLYGVTQGELFKIKINSNSLVVELILVNSYIGGAWYGAAGRNEAVAFEVKVFETLNNAQKNVNPLPSVWTNTVSGGQTVYISVLNTINLQQVIVPIDLKVNAAPSFTNPLLLEHCIDDVNASIFDIRMTETGIIGSQSNVLVTYHETEMDAINNSNPLSDSHTVNSNSKQIYVRVTNSITNCYSNFYFELKIIPKPIFNRPRDLILCKSFSSNKYLVDLDMQIPAIIGSEDSKGYLVTFYNSQEDAFNNRNSLQYPYYIEKEENEIFVKLENEYSKCSDFGSFNVHIILENQNFKINYSLQISDWTYQENSIEIIASGNFEYSLDGIDYQDTPIFKNLSVGDYKIYIRDKDNCSVMDEAFFLLMYPKYFTPNGDNINDYWNIISSSGEPDLKIFIYDRYGKLVKMIQGTDNGWDGSYNNAPLPTADYWFEVIRANGEKRKGHFSLKR